jgi:hypothetical protein
MSFTIEEIIGVVRPKRHCDRKTWYGSKAAAEADLRELRARPDCIEPARLQIYACRFGANHFHLGHGDNDEPRAVTVATTAEAS